MKFQRIEPSPVASRAVECYWVVGDEDTTPVKQKIIPDGFAEIIFHFGDPYRIQLNSKWSRQGKSLLAAQIKGHFYLENTGVTEIVGIKLKPAAVTHLFDMPMKGTADSVRSVAAVLGRKGLTLEKAIRSEKDNLKRIEMADTIIAGLCSQYPASHPIDRALEIIFAKKGMVAVADICKELSVGERYVEKLFQTYVGLSPKFFARIIRFSHIFQLIKDKDPDWSAVVFEAGYYDQSHFIRNFKAFTGEDPSEYIFAEKTLANFFMKKTA
jgi:AraC-like DNA-binding protein